MLFFLLPTTACNPGFYKGVDDSCVACQTIPACLVSNCTNAQNQACLSCAPGYFPLINGACSQLSTSQNTPFLGFLETSDGITLAIIGSSFCTLGLFSGALIMRCCQKRRVKSSLPPPEPPPPTKTTTVFNHSPEEPKPKLHEEHQPINRAPTGLNPNENELEILKRAPTNPNENEEFDAFWGQMLTARGPLDPTAKQDPSDLEGMSTGGIRESFPQWPSQIELDPTKPLIMRRKTVETPCSEDQSTSLHEHPTSPPVLPPPEVDPHRPPIVRHKTYEPPYDETGGLSPSVQANELPLPPKPDLHPDKPLIVRSPTACESSGGAHTVQLEYVGSRDSEELEMMGDFQLHKDPG